MKLDLLYEFQPKVRPWNKPHPYGQRGPRPPAYYKHQKLLATPGQRTRVNKKSSGVIFQGPMHGSS